MKNKAKIKGQLLRKLSALSGGNAQPEIERDKAEPELSKAEKILESITQGITENILLITKDFKILWANKAALEAYGPGIIGEYCYRATHRSPSPCKPPLDPCPISDFCKDGKPVSFQHIHMDQQGSERYVEVSVYPVKDGKNRISQFIHFSRDITERRQAEEALQKSREEARRLGRENEILAKMGRVISSSLNVDEVYERFADEVRKIMPFDRIVISIINPEENTATVSYVSGIHVAGRGVTV